MQLDDPMIPSATRRGDAGLVRTFLLAIASLIVGVLVALGVFAVTRNLFDDSRTGLALSDVIDDRTPGFENAAPPSADACGDRSGCVQGIQGDGVAIYRYLTLDLARQAVVTSDADVYRSDRIVIEFEGGLTAEEQFWLLQGIEGTWTRSEA
jgi:hypothetical protein